MSTRAEKFFGSGNRFHLKSRVVSDGMGSYAWPLADPSAGSVLGARRTRVSQHVHCATRLARLYWPKLFLDASGLLRAGELIYVSTFPEGTRDSMAERREPVVPSSRSDCKGASRAAPGRPGQDLGGAMTEPADIEDRDATAPILPVAVARPQPTSNQRRCAYWRTDSGLSGTAVNSHSNGLNFRISGYFLDTPRAISAQSTRSHFVQFWNAL